MTPDASNPLPTNTSQVDDSPSTSSFELAGQSISHSPLQNTSQNDNQIDISALNGQDLKTIKERIDLQTKKIKDLAATIYNSTERAQPHADINSLKMEQLKIVIAFDIEFEKRISELLLEAETSLKLLSGPLDNTISQKYGQAVGFLDNAPIAQQLLGTTSMLAGGVLFGKFVFPSLHLAAHHLLGTLSTWSSQFGPAISIFTHTALHAVELFSYFLAFAAAGRAGAIAGGALRAAIGRVARFTDNRAEEAFKNIANESDKLLRYKKFACREIGQALNKIQPTLELIYDRNAFIRTRYSELCKAEGTADATKLNSVSLLGTTENRNRILAPKLRALLAIVSKEDTRSYDLRYHHDDKIELGRSDLRNSAKKLAKIIHSNYAAAVEYGVIPTSKLLEKIKDTLNEYKGIKESRLGRTLSAHMPKPITELFQGASIVLANFFATIPSLSKTAIKTGFRPVTVVGDAIIGLLHMLDLRAGVKRGPSGEDFVIHLLALDDFAEGHYAKGTGRALANLVKLALKKPILLLESVEKVGSAGGDDVTSMKKRISGEAQYLAELKDVTHHLLSQSLKFALHNFEFASADLPLKIAASLPNMLPLKNRHGQRLQLLSNNLLLNRFEKRLAEIEKKISNDFPNSTISKHSCELNFYSFIARSASSSQKLDLSVLENLWHLRSLLVEQSWLAEKIQRLRLHVEALRYDRRLDSLLIFSNKREELLKSSATPSSPRKARRAERALAAINSKLYKETIRLNRTIPLEESDHITIIDGFSNGGGLIKQKNGSYSLVDKSQLAELAANLPQVCRTQALQILIHANQARINLISSYFGFDLEAEQEEQLIRCHHRLVNRPNQEIQDADIIKLVAVGIPTSCLKPGTDNCLLDSGVIGQRWQSSK